MGIVSEAEGVIGSAGSAISTAHLPDWAVPALEKVMPMVAGAALRPKHNPVAPLGSAGHSVSVNTSGYGGILKDAQGLGEHDPLQGLSGFKNLL